MEILRDDEFVQLSFVRRDVRRVVVCFAGIGHLVGGVNVQQAEFRQLVQDAAVLHVIDKTRSWGNSLDFADIAARLEAAAPGAVVDAIGNSMGGFNAILATKFIPVRTCVAFVPQFSVHPEVIPTEKRWRKYLQDIIDWRYRDLSDAFQPSTRYYIFAGLGGVDDAHLARFPNGENIQKILLANPRFHHNVSLELKGEKKLYAVIADCFAGRSAQEIAATHLPDEEVAMDVERAALA